jgi:hypothetical protein
MESLSEPDRNKALKATVFLCIRELQGIEPEEQGAQELGFGSVEAVRIQLNNWGIPDWITRDRRVVEKPKRPKPAPRKRQARGSGPAVELPPAGNVASLFREQLEVLVRAAEELKHRKEKLQGGRFVQSSMYADPILLHRKDWSDEEWRELSERYNLDAGAESLFITDGFTWTLGERHTAKRHTPDSASYRSATIGL